MKIPNYIIYTEHFVHVYMRSDGLCGCVTCDSEYPVRVAFSILTSILEDFAVQNPTWKQGMKQKTKLHIFISLTSVELYEICNTWYIFKAADDDESNLNSLLDFNTCLIYFLR
jgi:Regulated-SNARE-like domain